MSAASLKMGRLPANYSRQPAYLYTGSMASGSKHAAETAAELMKAMIRLRARLRAESAPEEMPSWTWSQLTTLGRIIDEGPTTVSELAHAEHVRRQSMAETIASLRAQGLIASAPDPDDGRKTLISASVEGRALMATIPAAREKWLSLTIGKALGPDEQQTLLKAAAIMNQIADSEV
jgi:DNA-binding MarR family transcriptional regulator